MALDVVFFIVGLAAVLLGAEWLVRGSSGLALRLGVHPLLVGLTVVAWGTGAPECTVSAVAALQGKPEIAVGNVVGSNIFNVLFILGLSAAATPLAVDRQLIRRDVPLMIAASFAVWFLVADEQLGRFEGLFLLAGFLIYTLATAAWARRAAPNAGEDHGNSSQMPPRVKGFFGNGALVLLGLGFLVQGSRWLVAGAAELARWAGVSELVIGLTIVAGGTSLPELATSVVASLRGERDIAVGNVVGSNIFNLLAVLGVAAALAPQGLPVGSPVFRFDLPVMTAAAFACLPIAVSGGRIARWEGLLLVAYGFAYWAYVLLAATHHDRLAAFEWVFVAFVVPLTVTGLAVSLGAHLLRSESEQRGNGTTSG